MARAVVGREVIRGELVEIERWDGSERRAVVNSATPVLDSDGNVIAAVVAQTDITELLRAQRELRESELRCALVFAAFALRERGLRLELLRDVGVGAEPADDPAGLVPLRVSA